MIEFGVDGYFCERCDKWHWRGDLLFKIHYKEIDEEKIQSPPLARLKIQGTVEG